MLDGVTKKTADLNFAIESLKEEMQAVNDYMQRAEIVESQELKEIVLHHAKEEMEHAAMLIEWIRRNRVDFGKELEEYLFTTKKIIEVELEEKTESVDGKQDRVSLNIGSFK